MKKIFKNNWILAYKKQGVYHLIISGHELLTPEGENFEKIKLEGNSLKLYSKMNELIISLTGPISLIPIKERFEKVNRFLLNQALLETHV